MTPETIEKTLNNPDSIIGLATKLKGREDAEGIDVRHWESVTMSQSCHIAQR